MEHIYNFEFLKPEVEEKLLKKKLKNFKKKKKEQIKLIVKLANLIRDAFRSQIYQLLCCQEHQLFGRKI